MKNDTNKRGLLVIICLALAAWSGVPKLFERGRTQRIQSWQPSHVEAHPRRWIDPQRFSLDDEVGGARRLAQRVAESC